ncbi:MAG: ATP phosphoribosyltransferase regulatory subunit [Bacteroides sp.]|nr:ATP phosphoribosyltransferase regulatory subunit [Bacteroides sp.]MCM1549817.1 ATP phosphoribosyltransferase regulatory subunit [Clostridium sp.]
MKEKLLHTPDGVRDIYDNEYKRKRKVMEELHHVLELYSYHDIQTPTFEYFDIFSKDKGSAPSNEMFKLFDRENNTLVLRPDITPSIARCVAKYYENEELPIRLCYEGNTYSNKVSHQGKLCEVTQLGVEFVNDDSSAADAELLATVVDCFQAVGLKEFQIEVGEIEFFKGVIEEAGLDEDQEITIREYIMNKNFFGLQEYVKHLEISGHMKQILTSFDQLFGGPEMLEQAKKLVQNQRSQTAISRLEKVYHALSYYHCEEQVSFDLSMLSDYKYYTGILFKGYTYGTGDAVVRGGRYNALLKQFGKDAPAIGFAFVIDELMKAIDRQNIPVRIEEKEAVLLYHQEWQQKAIELGCQMRRSGKKVELIRMSAKRTLEDYMVYAEKEHFETLIYIREDGSEDNRTLK